MKKIGIFIIIIFLNSCLISDIFIVKVKEKTWLPKSSPKTENYVDTISIEVIGGLIVGELSVAGNKRKAIFDTGAPTALDIVDTSIERVKTRPKPTRNHENYYDIIELTTGFKSVTFGLINLIDTLEIGKSTFLTVGASTVSLINYFIGAECHELINLIGTNVMNDGVWSFNYQQNEIIFSNRIDSSSVKNHIEFDLIPSTKLRMPVFEILINGITYKALIDTGNASKAILIKKTSEEDKNAVKFSNKIETTSPFSLNHSPLVPKKITSKTVEEAVMETSSFGNCFEFEVLKELSVFTDKQNKKNDFDLVLGYDFLKYFNFTIDWVNDKIYFEPLFDKPVTIVNSRFNFKIDFFNYDKKLYVTSYLPNYFSPEEINVGDTVKAINHIPIEEIVNKENYCEVVRGERDLFPKQDTTIVTVKNKKGETRDLKMYEVTLFRE